MGSDIGQTIGIGACAVCLLPLLILLVVLRLAAWLEGVALRHPLLLWMVPLAMWRRAERLNRETDAYCAEHSCLSADEHNGERPRLPGPKGGA